MPIYSYKKLRPHFSFYKNETILYLFFCKLLSSPVSAPPLSQFNPPLHILSVFRPKTSYPWLQLTLSLKCIQNVTISHHFTVTTLIKAVISHLDDYNSPLTGLPAQPILNTSTFFKKSDHINPLLKILQMAPNFLQDKSQSPYKWPQASSYLWTSFPFTFLLILSFPQIRKGHSCFKVFALVASSPWNVLPRYPMVNSQHP